MATIVIKDLPESMDLDRQAMAAIIGGSRVRGRQISLVRAPIRREPFSNFSAGFPSRAKAPSVSLLLK